jgi:hypothetical protein
VNEPRLPLFDGSSVVEAEVGIALATKKLERPDGPAWLADAVEAIRSVARSRLRFTCDDVWAAMGGGEETYRSQMGIAFRVAKRAGLIEVDGTYLESRRAPRHRSPVRVWRSLMMKPSDV